MKKVCLSKSHITKDLNRFRSIRRNIDDLIKDDQTVLRKMKNPYKRKFVNPFAICRSQKLKGRKYESCVLKLKSRNKRLFGREY